MDGLSRMRVHFFQFETVSFYKLGILLSLFYSNFLYTQQILTEKVNYDAKIYKILLKELKTGEKLEKAEPTTANTFRVYSTRIEILKFLKTKNVEDLLKDPNSSVAKNETNQIQNFFLKTKEIGNKIDKDSSFKERPKFKLLHGLMLYDFEEKNTDVPKFLESAFVSVSEGELKHLAASKLGDYYFNLPNFSESAKYYREALRLDPKSEWRSRHLYNLSWCFFKLENYKPSIKLLLNIISGVKSQEDRRDFYYQQAMQKVPFFYLYDNSPEQGYAFIKKNNGVDGPEIINFLKEVYNKGFFDKIDALLLDTETSLESEKKFKNLMDLQLEIYFSIATKEYKKNYSMLSRMRKGISKADSRKILTSEKKVQFISDNKSLLNQHLELVNRKTFDPVRNLDDKNAIEDSVDILRLLITMDPNNTVSYRLKLAQLYNKTGQKDLSLKMLWEDYLRYGGVSNPEAGPYLAEILAVVDAMGDKAPTENVEKIYSDYMKVGKDQSIRKVVYLKYFDFYFNRGEYKKAIELMKSHQSEFPSEVEDRKRMFAKVLNQSLKQNDKVLFDVLREHAKNDAAINSNQPIMKSVNAGHNTFLLEKVNKSLADEKADKAQAASKLAEIFRSNSIDRSNQLISGFNAGLIFVNVGNNSKSTEVYNEFIDQLNPQEFNEYHDKLVVIAENQLLLGQEEYGINVYQRLIQSQCKNYKSANNQDVLRVSEFYLIRNSESYFIDLINSSDRCKWSEDLRKKVYNLIVEYVNWNDHMISQRHLKYLVLLKVNNREEVEKNVEQLFINLINVKDSVDVAVIADVQSDIEKNWLSPLAYSSDFSKELKSLLTRSGKIRNYSKDRVNAQNFSRVITKAFDTFAYNLDLYSSFKAKYITVSNIKSLLEILVLQNFINSFKDFGTLIDDVKNKPVYLDQLNEAISPLTQKMEQENQKLYNFMQAEGTLISHKTLIKSSVMNPVKIQPFILDRL